MEALHKQVMPFLLRRTKDEVLSDLPEKIIQDRYCDLSPVQLLLYEQFSGSHVKQEISSMVKTDESGVAGGAKQTSPKASTHVFQVKCFDSFHSTLFSFPTVHEVSNFYGLSKYPFCYF